MIEDISFMCTLGGFHLTKWLSNAREVIEVVPESDRAKSMKDLSFDSFPDDRALGVHWKLQTDSFGFNVAVTDAKPTRRNLLSITKFSLRSTGTGISICNDSEGHFTGCLSTESGLG